MSPPQTRRGALADSQDPTVNALTASPTDHPNHDTTVRVPAAAYGPSARRTMTVNVVARCPFCGGSHVHRGNGGLRRAGCGRGEYVIIPREEHPDGPYYTVLVDHEHSASGHLVYAADELEAV